jgi:hypothetical protein
MPVRLLFVLVCVVPEKISAAPLVGAEPVDQFAPVLQKLFPPPPVQVTLNSWRCSNGSTRNDRDRPDGTGSCFREAVKPKRRRR